VVKKANSVEIPTCTISLVYQLWKAIEEKDDGLLVVKVSDDFLLLDL